MTEFSIWTQQDLGDFDSACNLLMSASCCIGLRDEVAQELVGDVLRLLNDIASRSRPGLEGSAPHAGCFH